MLTRVDHRDGYVVFKVTNPKNEVLCYRVFPEAGIGDSAQCKEYKTLTEARDGLTPIMHRALSAAGCAVPQQRIRKHFGFTTRGAYHGYQRAD